MITDQAASSVEAVRGLTVPLADDIIGSLFEGTRIRLCERGLASELDERFTARSGPAGRTAPC